MPARAGKPETRTTDPLKVVVVGAGIGGLSTALALGRAGRRVTLVERDRLEDSENAEGAWRAERRGVPQTHQTHGFLARLTMLLRESFPDVYQDLLSAGGTTMSMTAKLGAYEPGDEDLAVLVLRRSTLEWVLRRAVKAEASVEMRGGVGARGLVVTTSGGIPAVRGIELEKGEKLDADLVVDAAGRRSPLPAWLAPLGVSIEEQIHESGLVYLSRWYRFPGGPSVLSDPKLGGDLGFVKFLGVPGDGETLSVTLAVAADDSRLRRALIEGSRFDTACGMLPGPDGFFSGGPLEPLTNVLPMGGLLNRLRRFTAPDGAPLVTGVLALGDAHTCTNPLYGRGCSLAMVQALLLRDALASHPGDVVAVARDYEASCVREVEPWFHVSVETDKAGADPRGLAPGAGPPEAMKAIMAVFAAAETDTRIARALVKFWNLLSTPLELMNDPVLMARMAEIMANPDDYPLPPREGPTREELLARLDSEEAAYA